MDNKVNFLRGTSAEYEATTKDNDTFYYTTDDEKLYLGGSKVTGIGIDDTSTTATDKTWSAKKINDSIPTELPANGGNADTVNTIAGDMGDNTGNVYPVFVDSNNSTSTAETLKTSELLQFWGSKGGVSLLTIGGQKSSSGLLKLYDGTGDYSSALRAANNPSSNVNCYLPDKSGTLALKEDIPEKLPADGGNADTVDGKHASDFMQNLGTLTTGSLLDYVLTMTNSGYLLVNSNVTDTPISGQFFFVDVRRDAGGSYAITATRFNAGGVWTNRYNASAKKWYGWANVVDGGTVASSTSSGIVSTGKQHFKGQKLFDDNVWVSNPNIVMGNGAPSADTSRVFAFTSSDDSMNNASAYMQNVARAAGNNELYLALRSLTSKTLILGLGVKINADGSNHYTFVTNPPQSTQVALRNISSGTASANKTNCPSGSWYGKHS